MIFPSHHKKVKQLQDSLRTSTMQVSLTNSNSNTLRNGAYKKNLHKLDLSSLNQVLQIDEESITVEPRITMESLVAQTLKQNLMPAVVPEFRTITVGGAIMGTALESSSFRYGQFSDICLEYELILGDGSLVTASATENADLFYAMSGSYGTLALLTAVKLRLIPSKPSVALTFSYSDTFPTFESSGDFLEGLLLAPSQFVTIEGNLSEKPTALLPYWSSWFIQKILEKKSTLHLSIEDYLFRYDRGAFWMGRALTRTFPPLPIRLLFNTFFRVDASTRGCIASQILMRAILFMTFTHRLTKQKVYLRILLSKRRSIRSGSVR